MLIKKLPCKNYISLAFISMNSFLNIDMNVSIAQKNPSCKICINLALIFTNLLLNIDMNVNIAQKNPPCKMCFNMALNLYKITFEYKDKCKDCSSEPSLQN